ncbi:MAG: inhibitor of sigma-G Gin [Firmicutes bacterium]|jgi:hypothetical protein|nr:inhibitor of sigma-G Gin [Bacillota bacterium]HPZ91289.1 sigma factor G inhibitor Gin [Bacillota bacterium]
MVIAVKETRELHKCHICTQLNAEGIWLVRGYICAGCLSAISATDVKDPRYAFYVRKLKELWQTG